MIILISGKAEAGKTTLANMIAEESSVATQRVSFGDAVKYIASQLGWDGKKDTKGRNLLQMLGDGVRAYSSGFWVKRMIIRIDGILSQNKDAVIIIDDARYFNELSILDSLYPSVYKIRIKRSKYKSSLTEEQMRHPSETELDNHLDMFDHFVFNDGTLDDLREVAKGIVKDVIS